jgi:hypothetical protein
MNESDWDNVYTKVSSADILRSVIGVHVPDSDAKFMADALANKVSVEPQSVLPLNGTDLLKKALGCSDGSINGIRQQIGRQ